MINFGINQVGVYKYQQGTPKGGFSYSSDWTSEDLNPSGYKKQMPIEKQKELIIDKRQKQGLKNFDKGMRILWGVARLHPATALGTDIIDTYTSFKNKDFNEYATNVYAGGARGFDVVGKSEIKPQSQYRNKVKYHRAKAGKALGFGLGKLFAIPDMIDDTIDLYNTITE